MKWKKISLITIAIVLVSAAAFFLITGLGKKEKAVGIGNQTAGVYADKIIIGSTSALTGHVGFFAEYVEGARAYIKRVNERGGIWGRKIELVSYDDQYDPNKTVFYTQKLINEDKAFALLNYVGTPTGTRVMPLIEEAGIPLLGIGSGAQVFRTPVRKYVYNLRASYHQEVDAFVTGVVEELGIKKIAVFYQYDAYGFDGLEGVETSLKRYDLKPVAVASYERGTLEVEKALETISASQAEAVMIVGVYSPSAKFIKLARERGFNPLFGNLSFTGSEALASELGAAGNGVVVTQVVPPVTEAGKLTGVDEYVDALAKASPGHPATFSGLEGFMDAKVLVEGLQRAGQELTRKKLLQALEGIQQYDLGIDSTVDFSPTQHQGMQRVYLTHLQDGKFVLFENWQASENSLRNR